MKKMCSALVLTVLSLSVPALVVAQSQSSADYGRRISEIASAAMSGSSAMASGSMDCGPREEGVDPCKKIDPPPALPGATCAECSLKCKDSSGTVCLPFAIACIDGNGTVCMGSVVCEDAQGNTYCATFTGCDDPKLTQIPCPGANP